ncbi:hypothetical protein [Arthrobacter zhaoguopingii]|uniref:hypothetical protein n=1 Tax=Arthrobacter zhaoguopingii TaxID=2681491 RepID=UPI00135A1A40|nr:hypothetical protein [Arthrobacter zhaoguopingii]
MGTRSKSVWTKKTAAIALLPFGVLSVAACSDTAGTEEGTSVEDVVEGETDPTAEGAYNGIYDQNFYDEADSYTGQEVTVSAEVTETLSDDTFVIAGGDDTTVDPLLIVEEQEIPPLDEGQVVELTGTVEQEFDVAAAEDNLGIDLEDELYADYLGEPYLSVTSAEILEEK